MSYWFRVKVMLSPGAAWENDDEHDLVLHQVGDERVTMEISSKPSDANLTGRRFVLTGQGYGSESEAYAGASDWRDAVIDSFAQLRVGADFLTRAAGAGGLSEAFRQELSVYAGRQILNDANGIMVFEVAENEARPQFSGGSAHGAQVLKIDQLLEAIADARSRSVRFDDRFRAAYDLFGGSYFERSVDARLVTLTTALETLIERQPRTDDTVDHVNTLIAATNAATHLDRSLRDSLIGGLRDLRREAITQAGARLASMVGQRTYMDNTESPEEFFKATYEIRSKLVHGAFPRPDRDEVNARAAHLQVFVANLLSAISESKHSLGSTAGSGGIGPLS